MEAEEGSPHRLRGAILNSFLLLQAMFSVKGVLHSAVGVVVLEIMVAQGSVRVYPLLESPVDCLGNMPVLVRSHRCHRGTIV